MVCQEEARGQMATDNSRSRQLLDRWQQGVIARGVSMTPMEPGFVVTRRHN